MWKQKFRSHEEFATEQATKKIPYFMGEKLIFQPLSSLNFIDNKVISISKG
jgi:hypothetical protein